PPGAPHPQFGEFGPTSTGADGDQHAAGNPYGAPMAARRPEQVSEARHVATLGRGGHASVVWLSEARARDLPEDSRRRLAERRASVEAAFDGPPQT
ncbi:MAG: hypothetical protein ABW167_16545, partial [Baekduia sp.]